MIFRSLVGLLLVGVPVPCVAQRVALRGTVVMASGPVVQGTVLIDGSRIVAAGADVKVPAGVKVVETGGIIYPGLIDLHDHVTWNALGRWSAGVKSGARYDWQQMPEYQMALGVPHMKMVAEGNGCAAERYAEVKSLVGGATSQAGLSPRDLTEPGMTVAPESVPAHCLGGWVRELGVASRLDGGETLRYEVFPLGLDQVQVTMLAGGLKDGTIKAAMFHIAEGDAQNASARREFGMLKARGLLVPGVSIIHGVALSEANFADMAKAHVGLVWSPRSNFELYGSTANVAGAKRAGVTMAIAPDWSPTGSDGMLEELKYAATWNATQDSPPFTDRELFEMATRNAAGLGGIGAQTGEIAVGKRADLLVLMSADGDPYGALVHASVGDAAMVMVDGAAVYGDAGLMKQVRGGAGAALLSVCGRAKELGVGSDAWTATVAELTAGLGRWGAGLSGLGHCR
ncbi:amidohydrolase family protein [Granulicella sibirica]|uniref:S-adenosylhomocysteine deaminase n=1 Tax=Granulicella sibirica TaxID=2479048 RepID=A0A4Q0SYI4_9BACT|nr:amidohydrolase family protein [Granulicella sibirica]RXH54569.1 S-adenosylhomocysteine deaminase [Granulicella sibirica]